MPKFTAILSTSHTIGDFEEMCLKAINEDCWLVCKILIPLAIILEESQG